MYIFTLPVRSCHCLTVVQALDKISWLRHEGHWASSPLRFRVYVSHNTCAALHIVIERQSGPLHGQLNNGIEGSNAETGRAKLAIT